MPEKPNYHPRKPLNSPENGGNGKPFELSSTETTELGGKIVRQLPNFAARYALDLQSEEHAILTILESQVLTDIQCNTIALAALALQETGSLTIEPNALFIKITQRAEATTRAAIHTILTMESGKKNKPDDDETDGINITV